MKNEYDFVRINDRRTDVIRRAIGRKDGWYVIATCKTVDAAKQLAEAMNARFGS